MRKTERTARFLFRFHAQQFSLAHTHTHTLIDGRLVIALHFLKCSTTTPPPVLLPPHSLLRLLCVVISDHKINMRILKFYFFTICVRISFCCRCRRWRCCCHCYCHCVASSTAPPLRPVALRVASCRIVLFLVVVHFVLFLFRFCFCRFVVHLIHAMKDLARSLLRHMFCPFHCVCVPVCVCRANGMQCFDIFFSFIVNTLDCHTFRRLKCEMYSCRIFSSLYTAVS